VGRLNGGRLPLGVGRAGTYPVTYRDARTLTVWLDPRTGRVVDLAWNERITAAVGTAGASAPLSAPVAQARTALPSDATERSLSAARDAGRQLDRRALTHALALWCAVLGGIALLAAAGSALAGRSRAATATVSSRQVEASVRS
jgi:high-affinity iron transporter